MEILELYSLSWGIIFSIWSTCSSFPICHISVEPAPSMALLPGKLNFAVCNVRCDIALNDQVTVTWLNPKKNQVPQFSSRTPHSPRTPHPPRTPHSPKTPLSPGTPHLPDAPCIQQTLVVAGSGPDIAGTYTCSVTSVQPTQLLQQQTLHVQVYDDWKTGHERGTVFQTPRPCSDTDHAWQKHTAQTFSTRSERSSLLDTTSALETRGVRRRRNANILDTTAPENTTIVSETDITTSTLHNDATRQDNSLNSSTDRQEFTSGVTSLYTETSSSNVTGVVNTKIDLTDEDGDEDDDNDYEANTEDPESGVDEDKPAESCSDDKSALGKYGLLSLVVTVSVAFLIVLALLLILVLPKILSRKHQAEIKCETYNLKGPSKFASVPFTSSVLVETADVSDSRTSPEVPPEVTKTVTDARSEREIEVANNRESGIAKNGEGELITTENGLEVTPASVSTFLLRQLSQKEGRAEDH